MAHIVSLLYYNYWLIEFCSDSPLSKRRTTPLHDRRCGYAIRRQKGMKTILFNRQIQYQWHNCILILSKVNRIKKKLFNNSNPLTRINKVALSDNNISYLIQLHIITSIFIHSLLELPNNQVWVVSIRRKPAWSFLPRSVVGKLPVAVRMPTEVNYLIEIRSEPDALEAARCLETRLRYATIQ